MSENSQVLNTGQQATTNYDVSKIFTFGNRTQTAVYTNSTGGSVALKAGTVLGKITASGKLLPLQSDAVDGSAIPVGILAHDITVANGVTVTLTYVNAGDVEESKIILVKVGDTLATAISGRTIRDRIMTDTAGMRVVSSTELSGYDNQ